jgi:hypothetical protein
MTAFSERERSFIEHHSELLYSKGVAEGDLDDVTIGSAMIMDDFKGDNLPEDWQPNEVQRMAVYSYCFGFQEFWGDLIADPDTTPDEILTYADIRDVVFSVQRKLLKLVVH